jgi:hypothetical protein
MPPECGFIAINATALNIAINGSILAKPAGSRRVLEPQCASRGERVNPGSTPGVGFVVDGGRRKLC